MPRWSKQEQAHIDTVRHRLSAQLQESPAYPEVVGDRKIVRFLRGHDYAVDKVCNLMSNFLKWRKDKNVDEIRRNIVEGGMDHPVKFPKGDVIVGLVPQLVIAPDALDVCKAPICVEQYNFVPSEVFKHITLDDYIVFVTYSLEYKSIIVEQMSEHREAAYLANLSDTDREDILNNPASKLPPYGVLVNTCVIRDLAGVGWAHLGSQGQDVIKTVVTLASDNYPELMRKCFMINTPYVFNAVWYVVKGLLAARTIAKVSVRGSDYMAELLKEIDKDHLPAMVGGFYKGYTEYVPFPFDITFLCPDNVQRGYPDKKNAECTTTNDVSDSKNKRKSDIEQTAFEEGGSIDKCDKSDSSSSTKSFVGTLPQPPLPGSAVRTATTTTTSSTITIATADGCISSNDDIEVITSPSVDDDIKPSTTSSVESVGSSSTTTTATTFVTTATASTTIQDGNEESVLDFNVISLRTSGF